METTPRETELTERLEKMERTVAELTAQLDVALAENQRLNTENKLLREKVDKLVRKIFGKSSEKLDAAQLELLLQFSGILQFFARAVASSCPTCSLAIT